MVALIETNWMAFAVALGIGLLVAFWLWGSRRAASRERYRGKDALDEGAAPARRNQALIDAPSAAARVAAPLAASGPGIMAGLGEAIAAAAASEVVAAQKPEAAPVAPPAPVAAQGDNLTRIKGVGPKLSARLAELGVASFADIAAWTEADIARIDAQLGTFAGRPVRDNWVEQAKLLAADDKAAFEAKFGKI